jgi:DNA-binding MarR family transcriptional regulator
MKNDKTLVNSMPLDERFSYLVYRAALRIRLRTLRVIRESGETISPEQLILLLRLGEIEGMSQKELALRTFTDKPSMTRMITKLEKKGLMQRQKNKKDGRAFELYLTSKGIKVRDKLDKEIRAGRSIYHKFSKEEKSEFIRLLDKLYKNLLSDEEA